MIYRITLRKRAVKALEKINEPYYSNIKQTIYSLAHNPRPQGCKKLKGRDATESESPITVLSMIFLMTFCWWMSLTLDTGKIYMNDPQ